MCAFLFVLVVITLLQIILFAPKLLLIFTTTCSPPNDFNNDLCDLFLANEETKTRGFSKDQLNAKDRLGMAFEVAITNFFTEMGTLFASRPVPVIILSVALAAGLSTGMLWMDVTTDPIELWAAPTSRSRVEKDFFDETFKPFYRTEQIIIRAKNLSNVSKKDNSIRMCDFPRKNAKSLQFCRLTTSIMLTRTGPLDPYFIVTNFCSPYWNCNKIL